MKPTELLSLGTDLDVFRPDARKVSRAALQAGFIPPIPVTEASSPTVIWGWRIIRLAAELGIADLATKTVTDGPREQVLLALELEDRRGAYAWDELDAILSFAERHGLTPPEVSQISNAARGDTALGTLVARYRKLPQHIRGLVNANEVPLKVAQRIRAVPAPMISDNHTALQAMSHSSRRQTLELIAELLVAPDDPDQVHEELAQALASDDPQEAVRRLRFPTLACLEAEFTAIAKDVSADSGVRIEPPPYFEGDAITVSFQVRSCNDLVQRTEALDRLKERCDELLGIL